MIKTADYTDKVALRQKGWKWFGVVVSLQMLFVGISYFLNS
ncbi:KGW motif small protein [Acinetobacter bouvetii]|uniref:Uncharacterized protein n=1 Tax=Acinetobacter bouvetii TaxID=202951 RepID=A0A811G9U5_9GAMM|nr:KGW motif small protein [Acinetobacter bouvetii]CAB1215088.1 hypothetical protein SFB21_1674 [Acinetobacter bouvetii]